MLKRDSVKLLLIPFVGIFPLCCNCHGSCCLKLSCIMTMYLMIYGVFTETQQKFLENDFAMAAEKNISRMDHPEKNEAIRAAAYQTVVSRFLSLEKRFGLEADLVEAAAGRRPLDWVPEVL